jgi:predicted dehydrogenase
MVSAGGMANHHARMILKRDDCRIVSMCDPSEQARARLRTTLGAAAADVTDYETPDEMIAKEALDAVVITTPHTQHENQVKTALNAGLHVLVEKPMATTTTAARNMMTTAEQTGKVLAIAYQRHGEGKFIRARQLLQDNVIGEVRLIHVIIAQNCLDIFKPGASWRADPAFSGGGHFMDTGSHINDIMLWTTGLEPKRVFAFINNEGCLVDVVTAVSIEFTNGSLGSMSFISLSAEEWREEFTFYGTEGVMRFGHAEPLRYERKGEDVVLPRPAQGGKPPLHNFIEAIQGKGEVQAPPVCGLRVVQLTETAYRSAQSGQPELVG